MDAIFNFFGSILGYILWFFYYIVGNYGVAIILFTILFKVILFPQLPQELLKNKRNCQKSMQMIKENIRKKYKSYMPKKAQSPAAVV